MLSCSCSFCVASVKVLFVCAVFGVCSFVVCAAACDCLCVVLCLVGVCEIAFLVIVRIMCVCMFVFVFLCCCDCVFCGFVNVCNCL